MKRYHVEIFFEYEGYNGHDHRESIEYDVEARNGESAEKKAIRLLRKHWKNGASVKNVEVEEIRAQSTPRQDKGGFPSEKKARLFRNKTMAFGRVLGKLEKKWRKRKDWFGSKADDIWSEQIFPLFLGDLSSKDLDAVQIKPDTKVAGLTEDERTEHNYAVQLAMMEVVARSFLRHLCEHVKLKDLSLCPTCGNDR